MGLDSYLSASRYVSGWDHANDADKKSFASLIRAAGLKREDIAPDSPSGTLSLHVGYWRKANAIHGWFVKHVQGGKDECQAWSWFTTMPGKTGPTP